MEKHELPKNWQWTILTSLADNLDSRRVPINNSERNERIEGKEVKDLIPYYGATGKVGFIDKHLFDEELVLLGEDAAPFYEPSKPVAYLVHGKSWVNNHAHILRAKQATTNLFLLHYLNQFDYHGYVTGTTRLKLTQQSMNTIPVCLPPLPEQRRIVAKLEELFSRLDAGVATLRQTQAQLKRYRQSVLHAAVTGELTRAWRTAGPAQPQESGAALLQRIRQERRAQWEAAQVAKRGGQLPLNDTWKSKYEEPAAPDTSELPELPEGWVWESGEIIADFVDPQPSHRTPPEFEGGVAYIGMGDVDNQNRIHFDTARKVHPDVYQEHIDRYQLKEGDFFFGKIGTIGNPVKLTKPFSYTLSANVILVQPHISLQHDFLYWYMSGPFIHGHFKKNSKATTQAAFGIQKARILPVPVPPLAEQAEVVAEVERRLSVLDNLERTLAAELTRAERLRQSILHRAFTGQLVPQDPTDEPAAALLARLQAAPAGAPAAQAKRGRQPKATQTTLAL